ncbi:MAG: DUF6353 family protein [Anaerorhabdus sp.]|uniref:DUF6353 family protein n=1 Tax=Anaerorhabdus sp. TaxID=1872524 RepID=UPI002FCB6273
MKIMQTVNKVSRTLGKHSPALLSIGGILGLGTTAFLSYKAAKKVEVIVEAIEENQRVEEDIQFFNGKALTGDMTPDDVIALDLIVRDHSPMTRADIVKDVAGALALPVIVGLGSVTCIALSFYIQNNRIVSLAGALAVSTAEQAFYRNKYKEEHGEEEANKFYTPTTAGERTVTNAKGKEEKVATVNKDALDSMYGFWYEESSEYVRDDHDYNLAKIRSVAEEMDLRLFRKGTLSMNEVRDALGMARTRKGAMVGWTTGGGFDMFPSTTECFNQETGENEPQIYVRWKEPRDIFGYVEYND